MFGLKIKKNWIYAEPVRSPQQTKELVEQIHKEFYTASDLELAEAQEIIRNCESQDIKDGEFLRSIGFSSTRLATGTKQTVDTLKANKAKAEIVVRKQAVNSLYKFISFDKVAKICEKYNLRIGMASNYIGEIPKNKINDIRIFMQNKEKRDTNLEAEGTYYLSIRRISGDYDSDTKKLTEELKNLPKYIHNSNGIIFKTKDSFLQFKRDGNIRDALRQADVLKTRIDTVYEDTRNDLLICAPDTHFKGDALIVDKAAPDPVVLYCVNEGFRIVTAWGAEASDPDVVNEINN